MRGKAVNIDYALLHGRITPAYAGKSLVHTLLFQYHEDHPRLCGEKALRLGLLDLLLGSPPPMRGKDQFLPVNFHNFRITPAYAGKRNEMALRYGFFKDHPRLCGEKFPPSGLVKRL